MPGDPIEDETESNESLTSFEEPTRQGFVQPKDSSSPKDSPKQSAYGFDIETERRREAGFLEEIRRRRWTIEAYDDQGDIVETCHAAELSAAVELAKAMEEEYPRVDIITPKGSVLPRVHWRR